MTESKLLYSRQLPGGGWVTLESESPEAGHAAAADAAATSSAAEPARVVLRVERRTDPVRRSGHAPPVIAEAVAPSETVAFDTLYPIAASNVQLAQRILRWQADRRGDGMMR
jgi:hypothetical protein